MRGHTTHTEPGTGTQVHTFASVPDAHETPNVYTVGGKTWGCGREYWDSLHNQLVELVEVVGRSSWCDTREPSDCPPKLVFDTDFEGMRGSRILVDPEPSPDEDEMTPAERFTLREIPDPAGCEHEVWPGITHE